MPKSRNRKNHKALSAKRSEQTSLKKKKLEKAQRNFLMQLIEQEKNKGLFDNLPQINPSGLDINGPSIGPTIGPSI